ncbi:MAG: hypothetical protein JWR08_263 [Enterovirga sp.]|jgi:uncharacterized protein (DUF4415 family)|nr:hypothetical protein [Enterovirga sp.]
MEREAKSQNEDPEVEDAGLSQAELDEMIPAREFFDPETFATLVKVGEGQTPAAGKARVTMEIDLDTLAVLKAEGPHWKERVNRILGEVATGRLVPAKAARAASRKRA